MFLQIVTLVSFCGFVVVDSRKQNDIPITSTPSANSQDAVGFSKVCRMGGVDYLPGETWSDHHSVCASYKCLDNGKYESTRTGCLYKGVCKDLSVPWMDGCFTFQCVRGASTYRLTDAGCNQTDGQCLKVGQRRQLGCDVIECQIQGITLVNKIVKPGCTTKSGCKEVGNFWHDGCTIYKCASEGDNATVQPLPNDRMRWPDGQYALLRPKTGCPNDNEHLWSEGYRKHYGSGKNSFSSSLSLSGIYTLEYFTHEFCVRQLKTASSPGYKTHWGAGNYCVFRSRGKCPKGFTEGFLMIDDGANTEAFQRGTLPDGDYRLDTGFFFCCRNDGPITTSLELPNEHPFVLLQNTPTGCQQIKGMKSRVQTITFSDGAGPDHFKNGQTPYTQTHKADITLNLCYYEPNNQCDCVDESGEVIEANTERTIGCVVKRCSSAHGKKVVDILEGGCSVNNSCVPEGHSWSVMNGHVCSIKSCVRVENGSDVSFEISNVTEGCVDGTTCIATGDNKTDNCITSVCEIDTASNLPTFSPVEAACPLKGTCKAANSTWQTDCTTYQCDVTSQSGQFHWNIVPIEYGCDDGNGKCYKIGENVTDKCYDAVCTMSNDKRVVYLDIIKGGCRWLDGCKLVGETWSDGCHDYRCDWIYTESGFTSVVNATNVSCRWNGACYKEAQIWADGCINYTCAVSRHQNEVSWKVEAQQLACTDFSGNCVPVGGNITENCVTYQCVHDGTKLGMEPVDPGCNISDSCIKENEIYSDKENCVDYICHKVATLNSAMMQVTVAEYKCAFNNTCMAENETWEDGCRTRKCVIIRTDQSIRRVTSPVRAGCDDKGICRPVGYTKMTNNCREYQCRFKPEFGDALFTRIGEVCKSGSGQCKQVNSTWQELTSDICVTFRCEKVRQRYLPKVDERMCRDSSGNCQPVGKTGFQAIVEGILRQNCECRDAVAPRRGVSIYCS